MSGDYVCQILWAKVHVLKKFTSLMLARAYSVKIGVIFRRPVWKTKNDKKQTYMKTETCKLYSRDF